MVMFQPEVAPPLIAARPGMLDGLAWVLLALGGEDDDKSGHAVLFPTVQALSWMAGHPAARPALKGHARIREGLRYAARRVRLVRVVAEDTLEQIETGSTVLQKAAAAAAARSEAGLPSKACAECGATGGEGSGGRLLQCTRCKAAGCRAVYYCSAAHQKAHWPEHKKVCGYTSSKSIPSIVIPAPQPVEHWTPTHVPSREELEAMGARQLKALLAARGVSSEGLLEKSELVEKLLATREGGG
ncbi:hypothetical protein MNEG_3317 [Monoraphidium neglectum]|uniref:MYND-type domain-containing protein n=1 Tax=Monoraphidium neglectum TaxID=145388 RepID=A0A0D2K281_9CHLO|nr:hypothetical protein MNEG_3317 [Monoraphidium neglectum]KIZ04648.1 hypothetical protein MNEG_3317 [Monoraphidium neglectum]|eukprot:XP_013903667.1 hypothetical protein MNEG_3317 [Monoraphidium neglectum]